MVIVHTLGTALIDAGTVRVTPASVRKFALLLYLSAEPGRRVSRAVLRELIYPDQTEKNARHSLREMVYQLRQSGVAVDSDHDGIAISRDLVRTDHVELLARDELDTDQLRATEGGFLPGYAPGHAEAFTDWFEGYRARATFRLCKALLREIARSRETGNWSTTEGAARGCLALDPLNEEATIALAEMLALGGAKAQAVRLLDKFAEDLGDTAGDLKLAAARLRRRINERLPDVPRSVVQLPFVGREREMVSMNERLRLAREGQPQCITLLGEPGIGKSRLAHEFSSLCVLEGIRLERVAVLPGDIDRPMAIFVDVVPALLRLPGALGCSPTSMDSLKRLTRYERSESPTVLPSRDSNEAVSSAIGRAIVDLIDAVTAESPLILLLEDVQWLDQTSLDVLRTLILTRSQRRLLVLLTSRNRLPRDFLSRLDARGCALAISPLAPESTRTLIQASLQDTDASSDRKFHSWLAETCGGNPLYLRFLTEHFRSTGKRYSLSPSLRDLIDQRVNALDADALSVLQTTTLLGNHATLDRLQRALEIPHIRLLAATRHLETAGLLLQDGDRAAAAHPLIADSVERLSTPLSVRLARRRIAMILEGEMGKFAPAAHLWALATHWVGAGDTERGLSLLSDCARHALEIGRPRRAAEILLQAAALPLTADERQRVLEEVVRAADSGSELDLIMRASDLLGNGSVVHEDVELAIKLARISCRRNREIDEAELRKCVSAVGASISYRLRAGLALLVLADLNSEPAIVSDMFAKLSDVLAQPDAEDNENALKLQLIYYSSFGDIEKSTAIARRIAQIASSSASPVAADLLRKAAIGFWRAGQIVEFWEAIDRAYTAALAAGLQRLLLLISTAAASAALDTDDEARESTWLGIADQFVGENPELAPQLEYVTLAWELAIHRGNRLEAERCRATARQATLLGTSDRVTRWMRATELRMDYDSGEVSNPQAAAKTLLLHHRDGLEIGDASDAEVATCLHILIGLGKLDEATLVATRYLAASRRSRAPLNRLLRDEIDWLESVFVAVRQATPRNQELSCTAHDLNCAVTTTAT
jgi:DNA-binding SARP family transcriptional activator